MTDNIDLTLLANFLHQVINPLNGVCGTLDNLVDGEIPVDKREQRTRAARAQLEHCISLVRNLAFFSAYSANPTEFKAASRKKTTVIPQVIIEASMYFQEMARHKRMHIELDDSSTQHKIHADPDLIRQVFMNLFDNGVKYGKDGTTVRVAAWVQKTTGDLLIEVAGKSTPVPQDQREAIFELGIRGENAKAVVASGTGLGLYICRMIVRDVYDGGIHLETRSGGGDTVFVIRFKGTWQ